MCQIIGIERVASLHIGPLGREISLVVRIVMQLCKIAEEVLGLHLQTLPAGVVKKVFILKELKIQPGAKAQVAKPYIRESKLTRMILISSVIGTPSVIVDIDIVVLKLISKIEIAHLHRCQCIFDPGEITFSQPSRHRNPRRNTRIEPAPDVQQKRGNLFRIKTDTQIKITFILLFQDEVQLISLRGVGQFIADIGVSLTAAQGGQSFIKLFHTHLAVFLQVTAMHDPFLVTILDAVKSDLLNKNVFRRQQ